jgi:hypothetical protein
MMSRRLPPNPNLDYLKKQAKELRAQLLAEHPGLRLADAQRRLAGEYGFRTWAALKAHVLETPGAAFVGRWRADLARSIQSPSNLFREATLQISLEAGAVTIADATVDESGRGERNSNTLVVDGRAHSGQYGYAVAAGWVTPRHLRVALTKDGQSRGHVDYLVAGDGRTLTLTTVDSVIHFKRVGQRG